MSHTWPPTLADLKADLGNPNSTADQDATMSTDLASAVAKVALWRPDFNYGADPLSCFPDPTDDIWAGTLAYARRLYTRRRSPDGLIDMGDLGAGRVPTTDRDIDRLLGIGDYAPGEFA